MISASTAACRSSLPSVCLTAVSAEAAFLSSWRITYKQMRHRRYYEESPGSRLQPRCGNPDNLFSGRNQCNRQGKHPKVRSPRPARPKDNLDRFFSPKGGPSPAAASLLLLRAEDIETNPGPHCNTCGNPVRHGTSILRCSTTNCSTVPHKQFTCSGLHLSNLLNWWECPTHGGPKAPSRQFPPTTTLCDSCRLPIHRGTRPLACPGLPSTSPRCEVVGRSCHPSS